MSYVYLTIAIVSEITATMTLRATESFTRLWPSVVVVLCVCSSLYFFSLSIRTLNVAYVYAVWSGIGISVVSLLGWLVYNQKLDVPAIIGITLIIAGIVVLNLFSESLNVPEEPEGGAIAATAADPD